MRAYTPEAYAHITRLNYRQLLARPRTQAELAAYARAHNYRQGWVYWRMKEQAEQFGTGRAA
jgi:hypothetical protein